MKKSISVLLTVLVLLVSGFCAASADNSFCNVVELAERYEGAAYVPGGQDPATGFDCSGFVYYVFSSCGYTVSRTASGQNTDGMDVGVALIQPGDIVVFGSGTYATHTAIYLGGDMIIHALNESNGVVYSRLSDYPESVISVRRIA